MIFITGGARSGKSALAEDIAAGRDGGVVFIATAEAGDGEMRERIEEHRRRRPEDWQTIEAPHDLPQVLEAALEGAGTVLVDCLTVYLSNLILDLGLASGARVSNVVAAEVERLEEACRKGNGRVILVSNEVGMGIVPENSLARTFRDEAGRANQRLAALADEVYMCVSGIPMRVK